MTPDELKKVFLELDPEVDSYQLDKYLCWAFNVIDIDRLVEAEALDQDYLVKRLANSYIVKTGRG